MIINLSDIKENGLHLTGSLSTGDYALPLEDYIGWETITYDLEASILGTECLVQGSLSTEFKSPCARCLEPLPVTIRIDPFRHSYAVEGNETIDLTQDIREDILLDLPFAPRCELDEQNRCPHTGETYQKQDDGFADRTRDSVWGALDNFKKPKE